MSILNPFGSDEFINVASTLGEVRTDPFKTPDFANMLPDFSSIAMLPLKLSMYANTARTTWYGSKSLLRVGSRFQASGMKYRYRATTVSGMVGSLLQGTQRSLYNLAHGEAFTYGASKNIPASARAIAEARKSATLRQTWLGRFLYSDQGEKEYLRGRGAWKPGVIDNFLISKGSVENSLQKLLDNGNITKQVFDELSEDNTLQQRILKNLVEVNERKAFGSDAFWTPKYDKVIPEVYGSKQRPTGAALKAFGKKELLNARQVSVLDLIRGVEPGGNVTSGFLSKARLEDRISLAKTIKWTPNSTAKNRLVTFRATAAYTKRAVGAHGGAVKEAVMRAVVDTPLNEVKDLEAMKEFYSNIGGSATSRMKIAKTLRFGAAALFILPQITKVALGIAKKGGELSMRTAATMKGMFKAEFGDGMEGLSNSRMATERQRAVAAIQNAHMNARYLMGNEAPMYH